MFIHTLPYKKKPTMSTNDNVGFLYLIKTTIMPLPKLQAQKQSSPNILMFYLHIGIQNYA